MIEAIELGNTASALGEVQLKSRFFIFQTEFERQLIPSREHNPIEITPKETKNAKFRHRLRFPSLSIFQSRKANKLNIIAALLAK